LCPRFSFPRCTIGASEADAPRCTSSSSAERVLDLVDDFLQALLDFPDSLVGLSVALQLLIAGQRARSFLTRPFNSSDLPLAIVVPPRSFLI
jgi:hypothetical protein